MTERDPRRAYRVVDDFEEELAEFTGAPFAVAVDSATNAIFLSLLYDKSALGPDPEVTLPCRTYVGVAHAAKNAGYRIKWLDWEWEDAYRLYPTRVIDSARSLVAGGYEEESLTCLSFHAAKQLTLGRGGAILTDDPVARDWFRRARADGRAPGDTGNYSTGPGFHMYMPPPTAALGLWILSRWTTSPPLEMETYRDLREIFDDPAAA